MITLKVDNKKRIVIPDGKPGQIFDYALNRNGGFTLTPVKKVEPPPPKCKLIKNKDGVLIMDNGRTFTSEDVRKSLAEQFP